MWWRSAGPCWRTGGRLLSGRWGLIWVRLWGCCLSQRCRRPPWPWCSCHCAYVCRGSPHHCLTDRHHTSHLRAPARDTWLAVSLAFTYETDEAVLYQHKTLIMINLQFRYNIGIFFESFERVGCENKLIHPDSRLFLLWMYFCFWINWLCELFNDSLIKTVTCFVTEWINVFE